MTSPRTSSRAGSAARAPPARRRCGTVADGAQVGGHVLAGRAVAARRADHADVRPRRPARPPARRAWARRRRRRGVASAASMRRTRRVELADSSSPWRWRATASAACGGRLRSARPAAAPTRWVGESGLTSSGCARSSSSSSRNSASYSASRDLGRVEHVVEPVVLLDLGAEALDLVAFGCGRPGHARPESMCGVGSPAIDLHRRQRLRPSNGARRCGDAGGSSGLAARGSGKLELKGAGALPAEMG